MSRRNLEAFFRAQRIAYVNVSEARKAILPAHEPTAVSPGPEMDFHFVTYGQSENWLVFAGRRTPEAAEAMRHWARLFGDGFRPVFAQFRTHPAFRDIDGHPIDWAEWVKRRDEPNPARPAAVYWAETPARSQPGSGPVPPPTPAGDGQQLGLFGRS